MERSIDEVSIFYDGLDHPECVAVHPDGSVWAGGEAGQVYRISADGAECVEVANTGGFILGIAFSPDLNWMALCDLKKKCVWKLDLETRELSVFAGGINGDAFMNPNYPVFDRQGNLYVSDSGQFRKVNGRIFKFSPDGEGEIWHAGPFNFANGMALSADQQTLYVVCTFMHGLLRIAIDDQGRAGATSTVFTLEKTCPDGIAIDQDGALYVSCYAPNTILKVDVNGTLSTLVHDWEAHTICNPTNIAFGGKDNRDLFIANLGRWHISKLTLNNSGISLTGKKSIS